ncbi:MAG: hypothetical protein IPN86_23490 [Saprospiraceae bacterium]|nr:hypothetical protein [Saprospiraceae bacterium]
MTKNDFTKIEWRKGTKGWLKALFHIQTVWIWDSKTEKAQKRTLIIRKDRNKIKYSLSNFKEEEKSIEEFAYIRPKILDRTIISRQYRRTWNG